MDRQEEEEVAGGGEEEEDVLGAPMAGLNVEDVRVDDDDAAADDAGADADEPLEHGHGGGADFGDVGEEVGGGGGGGQHDNADEVQDVELVNHQPYVSVSTLERAVAVLEEKRPIEGLVVKLQQRERRATPTPAERAVHAAAFRRFVELLGEPNGRAPLSFLILQDFLFVSEVGFRIDDVRTLFGEVLPKKAGLNRLFFEGCEIDASLIRLLASALTTTSPSAIHAGGGEHVLPTLTSCKVRFDRDGLRAIAEMLARRDLLLKALHLDLRGMGPAAGKIVCGCLPCTRLQRLHLHFDKVSVNTLDHVAATSSLRSLDIHANWSPEAVHSLLKQLRTNTSLETLFLVGDIERFGPGSGDLAERVEDTLQTYNYTLQFVAFMPTWSVDTSRIESYLRRNRWIRGRMRDLVRPAPSAGLWPVVMQMVSGLPSLTYKLLRDGDITAFSDVLLKVSTKKRRRIEEIGV